MPWKECSHMDERLRLVARLPVVAEKRALWVDRRTMDYENPLVPPGIKSKKNKQKWWAHQDSNLGPTDYESGALTS